jgi:hypothetical protein
MQTIEEAYMHTIKKSILFFAVLAFLAGMLLGAVSVTDTGRRAAEPAGISWLADQPEDPGASSRADFRAEAGLAGAAGLISIQTLPIDFPGVLPLVAWGS